MTSNDPDYEDGLGLDACKTISRASRMGTGLTSSARKAGPFQPVLSWIDHRSFVLVHDPRMCQIPTSRMRCARRGENEVYGGRPKDLRLD